MKLNNQIVDILCPNCTGGVLDENGYCLLCSKEYIVIDDKPYTPAQVAREMLEVNHADRE